MLAGIRRVALLDFDVHHGNGTEACVRETAPSLRKFNFKTPFSEGSQTFPVYSPWLDSDDADNILFARYGVRLMMAYHTQHPAQHAAKEHYQKKRLASWPM